METGRISIVSMDLDGTLLNAQQKVSEENAEALRMCRERGIYVFLSSGRSFESVRTFATGLNVDCGIISCNGARLDASAYGPTLMTDCIPEEIAIRAFDELIRLKVYFECYAPGRVYMSSGFVERFHSHEARVLDLDGCHLEYIDSTERMRAEAMDRAYKFVVYSPDPAILAQAAEKLARFDIDITSSWGDNIELMKKGAGKGRALEKYAAHYGIPKDEIMTFGDQLNDMNLLEASAWPVAMENAVDGLKARARLIAPHHDEDGVGKMLRKYVLSREDTL